MEGKNIIQLGSDAANPSISLPATDAAPVPRAGLSMAAEHLRKVLSQFDPESIIPELNANPGDYIRIVLALVKLGEWELEHERYQAETADQKAAANRAKSGGGLDPETRESLEHELRLF